MSLAPLELLSAHPWRRAVFTTYALSLSFFEAVLLDALVRGGGRESLILADVDGVRASLSEQGAHRVGKDYEVEPVSVTGGVFHPKISVLTGGDEHHVLVGSGNLTFGGWGGNCEVLEHLHPSFAADAIEDVASFFDLITVTERIRSATSEQCAAVAADLRKSLQGKPRNGNIRLIHSLDLSIADQIAQFVADLGGGVRLVAAAPFWDNGAAIDRLCSAIGLDHFFLHAHPYGTVEGFAGSNWPRGSSKKLHAMQLDVLKPQGRRLHGKLFEINCKRGRLVVSGSANGTAAALDRDRNVEACIVRLQRGPSSGWTFTPSDPPEFQAALDSEDDTEEKSVGVLRAMLDADELTGEVLVPRMSGVITISYVTGMGAEAMGTTTISSEGTFRIAAPALEERSWIGGRLVIRVVDRRGRGAEGFVSIASYADITRRAGAIGRRLFAVLAGTETPEDVAAIMSWFYEDPRRLSDTLPVSGHGVSGDADLSDEEAVVPVAALAMVNLAAAPATAHHAHSHAHGNWVRFIEHVFLAFRQNREPLTARTNTGAKTEKEEEEGNESEPETGDGAEAAAIEKSLLVFDRLFDLLLSGEPSLRNVTMAFDLTLYICARLQPEVTRVKDWLHRLIAALLKMGVPPERRNDVAATVLLLAGEWAEPNGYRWARDYLLRMNFDFSGDALSTESMSGFREVLPQKVPLVEVWAQVKEMRTYPEQIRAYLLAFNGGQQSNGYADLAKHVSEEWRVLEEALRSASAKKRVMVLDRYREFCPSHQIALPTSEAYKLKSFCVATAKNCCGRVLVWTGEQ